MPVRPRRYEFWRAGGDTYTLTITDMSGREVGVVDDFIWWKTRFSRTTIFPSKAKGIMAGVNILIHFNLLIHYLD